MTTAVVIASAHPELAALACRSLDRYAPSVHVVVIPTRGRASREHADAMESQRGLDAEQVILLDDDAVVLSADWLPTLRRYHDRGYAVVGGIRSRGEVEQIIVEGRLIPHAHCLSFTREAWKHAQPFAAIREPGVPFLRYDTAVLATVRAGEVKALPFRSVYAPEERMLFGALPVAEYYDPERPQVTLWAHLMRGSGFAPRSRVREALRATTALWSPRSRKIRRRHDLRAAYLARVRELLA